MSTTQNSSYVPVKQMYRDWFLDYASYVILERAIPHIEDGFKPVQRRIMHAMYLIDDGRYNKAANIIGQTMQFHPHGDAAIADAIVHVGQKDLLIDTQGNWGDYRTGDDAAAARYIEARLSPFANEVLFSPKITEWQLSYDGRKKEPITLPVKFPLLLSQGAEGIAVGLSTKILPHNFIELIEAAICCLTNKDYEIFPDFLTGGVADCSAYNKGKRGGRVRVRAKITTVDKKTLSIIEIPYGTTTSSIIDSILKAHQKGKIKIKNVVDNTAENVDIRIHLAGTKDISTFIDALYVFTDCEVSIAPNACIIMDNKPAFVGADTLLRNSAYRAKDLLNKELDIKKSELLEQIFFALLERIFIEKKIYRDIEECKTWTTVIKAIGLGLNPYKKDFYRDIQEEDIVKLTEIKIKRISKYDSQKANDILISLKDSLAEVEHNIKNIIDYTIRYFKNLIKKYGKGRERKTELKTFANISAINVIINNQKLYVNKKDGFIGFGLKKDEFICECSDLDDIIAIRKDGKFIVTKIAEKTFVGKNIIHVSVFKKNDTRRIFNVCYLDGKTGITRAKRFNIGGITRDKDYDITQGSVLSKILYFSDNANGEGEILNIALSPLCKAKKKLLDFNFSDISIKGKGAQGNIITKYSVKKIYLKEQGGSTLGCIALYYDLETGRVNLEKGKSLGRFDGEDKIITIYKNGEYEINAFKIDTKYEVGKVFLIKKFDPKSDISAVYLDGNTRSYYAKKFKIETATINKKFNFLNDNKNTALLFVSSEENPKITLKINNKNMKIDFQNIEIRGWRAMGVRV